MPRFEKGSQEAKDFMKSLREKRGKKEGSGFDLLKSLTDAGTAAGEPFKATTGLNPFTLGYDLGHDVIAPAIKGRGAKKSGGSGRGETYGQLEHTFTNLLGRLHQHDPVSTNMGIEASMANSGANILNELKNTPMSPEEVKQVSKVVAKIRKPKK
jgi:hypothetical protein